MEIACANMEIACTNMEIACTKPAPTCVIELPPAGEEKGHKKRVYLLYSGIHYDGSHSIRYISSFAHYQTC
jgi:hypothetical protein